MQIIFLFLHDHYCYVKTLPCFVCLSDILNRFIHSDGPLTQCSDFAMYNFMSTTNKNTLAFSFPLCSLDVLYFLFFNISYAPSAVLSACGSRGHPCLAPELTWTFPHWGWEWLLVCHTNSLQSEICSFYTQLVDSFYHERKLSFIKWLRPISAVFCSLFYRSDIWYLLICKTSLYPQNKSHLPMMCDCFDSILD